MKNWTDTAKALFYGPGWCPGTERLGDLSTLPDKTFQRPKYDPQLPRWMEVYLVIHYFIILIFFQIAISNSKVVLEFYINYLLKKYSLIVSLLSFPL